MRTMLVGLVVALGSLAGASAAMADTPATVSVSAPGAFSETGGGLGWTGTSNTNTAVGATFYLGTLTRSASPTEPAGVRSVDLGLHVAVRPAGASAPTDVPLTATLTVGDDAISLPATAPSAEADVPTDALGHFDRYRLEVLGLTNGNAPPGPRMVAPRGATTNALLAARSPSRTPRCCSSMPIRTRRTPTTRRSPTPPPPSTACRSAWPPRAPATSPTARSSRTVRAIACSPPRARPPAATSARRGR